MYHIPVSAAMIYVGVVIEVCLVLFGELSSIRFEALSSFVMLFMFQLHIVAISIW
jgi:hypothetical protein